MRIATIFFIILLMMTGLLQGCALDGLTRLDDAQLTEVWCKNPPLAGDENLAVFGPESGHDPEEILSESKRILKGAGAWLGLTPGRFKILVFTPQDEEGRYFLDQSRTRHRATGLYNPGSRLVIAVGARKDPRFWEVLRHETVHALLDTGLPTGTVLPFWITEGTASLFEYGICGNRPRTNRERRTFMTYHLATDPEYLDLSRLIRLPPQGPSAGSDYAAAWALAAFFYEHRYPVSSYLRLASKNGDQDRLFSRCFLNPGQSMEELSKSCTRWLLYTHASPLNGS